MVLAEHQVLPEQQVLQGHRVQVVLQELAVQVEHRELAGLTELREQVEHQVLTGLQVQAVLPVQVVPQGQVELREQVVQVVVV